VVSAKFYDLSSGLVDEGNPIAKGINEMANLLSFHWEITQPSAEGAE
jgi:hypothetical protein